MKVYQEINLRDFDFCSGAKDTVSYLTGDDLQQIEAVLEDCYDEMSKTQINDFFWFESDFIAECLGYENWDNLIDKRAL